MRSPRIVLAKVGLDGHDVGVLLVAKQLSQAGFEVIYLGKRNLPKDVVRVAIDEDAAAVGVSSLSGGLGHLASETVRLLRDQGVAPPVLAGGIDEPEEISRMLAAGVHEHFGPGASTTEIVDAFRRAVSAAPTDRSSARVGGAPKGPGTAVP